MTPTQPPGGDPEPTTLYGYCPICRGKVIARERRIDGDSICENKHKFKSSVTIPLGDRKSESNSELIQEMKSPIFDRSPYLTNLLFTGAQRIELLEKDLATALAEYQKLEAKLKELK